jgi:hypothetical protein
VPERALALAQKTVTLLPGVLLSGILVLGLLAIVPANPAAAGPPSHAEQVRFMWAMAGQESGWDYYARNASSGAFGKYQIMPFNWPIWAAQYLGDAMADQTPWNQEKVAYGKIHDLYRWLGSWKRVAYWWLTGRSDRNERRWSAYARGYVQNIMGLRDRAPAQGTSMPARTSSRPARGDWRRASAQLRLRLGANARVWPKRGEVRDGQVLKVDRVTTKPGGVRWIRVITLDGRVGWLKHLSTVPAQRPARARRWAEVTDRGQQVSLSDRRTARPRPR